MDGYTRVEMSMSAVRDEDLDALRRAFVAMRNRYSAGGSSLGFESVRPGTVLNSRPTDGES